MAVTATCALRGEIPGVGHFDVLLLTGHGGDGMPERHEDAGLVGRRRLLDDLCEPISPHHLGGLNPPELCAFERLPEVMTLDLGDGVDAFKGRDGGAGFLPLLDDRMDQVRAHEGARRIVNGHPLDLIGEGLKPCADAVAALCASGDDRKKGLFELLETVFHGRVSDSHEALDPALEQALAGLNEDHIATLEARQASLSRPATRLPAAATVMPKTGSS